MDFDFQHIGVPFCMQPGLSRLPAGSVHLKPLDSAGTLYREKLAVSQAGAAVHCVRGFDTAPLMATLSQQALAAGIRGLDAPGARLELLVSQDLALVDLAQGTVPWMCVCVPSGWAPEDKLGLDLVAIHAPVADNRELAAAWPMLKRLLASGGHWLRHVWTVSPSPLHDLHPRRRAVQAWPTTEDPDAFAQACWFRAERQTLLPVVYADGRSAQQLLFTIEVMVEPLAQAVRSPEQAVRVHQSLRSMSDTVLAYKNLAHARAPLLQWLSRRFGADISVP